MKTTTAAGRTWHFSHSIGRETAEHNGDVGGFMHPVDVAYAADGIRVNTLRPGLVAAGMGEPCAPWRRAIVGS